MVLEFKTGLRSNYLSSKIIYIDLVPTARKKTPKAPELRVHAQGQGTRGHLPHQVLSRSWLGHQTLPQASGTAQDATGHLSTQGTRNPRGREQMPAANGKEVGEVAAEGEHRGKRKLQGPRKNERSGQAIGVERGYRWEPSAAVDQVKAMRQSNWSQSGKSSRATPRGSGAPLPDFGPPHRPCFPAAQGRTPPRPGEARACTSVPTGLPAPRLPRPRLRPARPRARSLAHAAGRGPRLQG